MKKIITLLNKNFNPGLNYNVLMHIISKLKYVGIEQKIFLQVKWLEKWILYKCILISCKTRFICITEAISLLFLAIYKKCLKKIKTKLISNNYTLKIIFHIVYF